MSEDANKLNLDDLSRDQLKAIIKHQAQLDEVRRAANNTLLMKISTMAGQITEDDKKTATFAENVIETLNDWSGFLNSVTTASVEEIDRIGVGRSPESTIN
ncbi:MAG: hypothetical protein KDJ90_21740 [Nitratireductor sp.]|nr:hypothetical protein [Nitratireductor sp.]